MKKRKQLLSPDEFRAALMRRGVTFSVDEHGREIAHGIRLKQPPATDERRRAETPNEESP